MEVEIQPIGKNGTAAGAEPSLSAIREKALVWAHENGLQGELRVQDVERVSYPLWGHGYVVLLQEKTGRERSATARFDAEGNASYWSMDGNVVL